MGEVRPRKRALRPSLKQETGGEQGARGGTITARRARGPQELEQAPTAQGHT